MKKLTEVTEGDVAVVEENNAKESLKERFLALGITKGSIIEVLRKGPQNNLTVYRIRGAMIALRREEGELIEVV